MTTGYKPLLLAGLKVHWIILPTASGLLATAKAVGYFLLVFIGSPVNRYFRFACLSNIIKLLFPFRYPIKLDTLIFVLYPLLPSYILPVSYTWAQML